MIATFKRLYGGFSELAGRAEFLALLAARLILAYPFWRSGLAKVDTITLFEIGDFRFRLPTPQIEQNTFFLFQLDFFPALPAWLANVFAVTATIGELTLPLLIVAGFLTRFAALGLLTMTMVIQIFVFPGEWWAVHAWWAALALVLLTRGGGALSLDRRLGL